MSNWSEDVYDWTTDYSMNVILYGPPKCGKTFVAAAMAKQVLDNNKDSKVYVINTDKGWAKPALQQGLQDYKDRIVYEYVNTIQKAMRVMNRFKEIIQPHDLIIFDLFSWVWDEAQKEFVNELSKGNYVGFIAKAMSDSGSFGDFTGIQWQYIKRLDDHISNPLSKNPICNVIAICRSKDVSTGYKIAGKEEDIWSKIGVPEARKDIAYEFANVIRIHKMDSGSRKFVVVASRDFDTDWKWRDFSTGEDFWNQIDEMYKGFNLSKPQDTVKEKDYTKLSASEKKFVREKISTYFKEVDDFTVDDVVVVCPNIHVDAIQKILDQGVKDKKIIKNGYHYNFPQDDKVEEIVEQPKVIEEIPKKEVETVNNAEMW